MKKLTSYVCAALLTFAVGIACVLLWFLVYGPQEVGPLLVEAQVAPEPKLAEVSLCQLVAQPETYEGKHVRVRAVYAFRNDRSVLADGSCAGAEAVVNVTSIPPVFDEIDRLWEKAHDMKNSSNPLEIVAVGILRGSSRTDYPGAPFTDKTTFEFNLKRVEEARGLY